MFEALDKLPKMCCLYDAAEHYIVRIYRQSGRLYKEDKVYLTKTEALASTLKTLRKSGKESAIIQENKLSLFAVQGMYNGRGSQEGKKVGRIEIHAFSDSLPPEPNRVEAVSATANELYKATRTFEKTKPFQWGKAIPILIIVLFVVGFLAL